MNLLCFDIATTCGWAFGPSDGKPEYGIFRLKETSEDYKAVAPTIGKRVRDYCMLRAWQPDLIVCEAPIMPYGGGDDDRQRSIQRNVASIIIPQRAVGGVQSVAACYGVDCREVSAATVRKHFVGRANFGSPDKTKAEVLKRCKALGYIPESEKSTDIGDAVALWDFAAFTWGKKIPEKMVMFGESIS